jgi:hypothetical protein
MSTCIPTAFAVSPAEPAADTPSVSFVQQWTQARFLLSVSCSCEVGFDRDGIVDIHSNHQWAEILDTSNCSVLMSGQVLLIVP